MANTKTWNVAQYPASGLFNTTGTWAFATASNITTFDHTDGDDTSILTIPVPKPDFGLGWQNAPSAINVTYTLTTADLDAAPTAVLNKLSYNSSTGVVTRSAVTQATIAFGGVDSTGTAAGAGAAGTHIVTVAPATIEALDDTENYVLELTFNAAATTVLKVTTISVSYA